MSAKPHLAWTGDQIQSVIQRYSVNNESPESIAKDFGCHRTSINNLLKKHGVPAKTTWTRSGRAAGLSELSESQIQQLVHEYLVLGLPIEQLADKYDVVPVTIRRKLIGAGVKMRPRGPLRHANTSAGFLNCISCREDKPIAEFYKGKKDTTAPSASCKKCVLARYRQGTYGVSPDEYAAMAAAQNGVCAICGAAPTSERNRKAQSLCLDHDHRNGVPRGLLCHHCNQGIGHFVDKADWIEAAAAYLRSYETKAPTDKPWAP